jgi:hypothetical protein
VFYSQPYNALGGDQFVSDKLPTLTLHLFQKQAEYYLDPESLAMASAFLAKGLKRYQ